MAVVGIGERLVLMQGFSRQKAVARNPHKKMRSVAWRRYVVPSLTPYSAEARLALMKAAIEMRGHTFEEVIANVVEKCSGKEYKPASIRNAEKQARYARADARVRQYEQYLGRTTGGWGGTGKTATGGFEAFGM